MPAPYSVPAGVWPLPVPYSAPANAVPVPVADVLPPVRQRVSLRSLAQYRGRTAEEVVLLIRFVIGAERILLTDEQTRSIHELWDTQKNASVLLLQLRLRVSAVGGIT